MCFGSATGLTTLLVSKNLPRIKRSWRNEERCTAILFLTRHSDKDLEQYEACVSNFLRVLREARKEEAKKFYISGDLNVELGMMCTDMEDAEELAEIYGPLR